MRRLSLGVPIALPEQKRYILRARSTIYREAFRLAPGNKCVDGNGNLFNALAATLEVSNGIKCIALPVFEGVIQLVSVVYDLAQPPPLLAIKPRAAYNHRGIGRVLGHGRFCRGLTCRADPREQGSDALVSVGVGRGVRSHVTYFCSIVTAEVTLATVR